MAAARGGSLRSSRTFFAGEADRERPRGGGPAARRRPVVLTVVDDSPAAPAAARFAGEVARWIGGDVVVLAVVPVPKTGRRSGIRRRSEVPPSREAAAAVGRVRPVLDALKVGYRVERLACRAAPATPRRSRRVAAAVLGAVRDLAPVLVVVGHADGDPAPWSVAGRLVARAEVDVLVVPAPTAADPAGETPPAGVEGGQVA